jgi:hypothetical protein
VLLNKIFPLYLYTRFLVLDNIILVSSKNNTRGEKFYFRAIDKKKSE